MSGGHFEYLHDDIVRKVFGWDLDADYNLGSDEQKLGAKIARRRDPLDDVELSEMIYDFACVLKAHDWWRSGDCGVDCYNDAKKYFKEKYFGKTQKERIEAQAEKAATQLREDIKNMFDIEKKEWV